MIEKIAELEKLVSKAVSSLKELEEENKLLKKQIEGLEKENAKISGGTVK